MKKLLFCLLFCVGMTHAEVVIPPLQARVTDLTGTLTPQQQQTLEQTLSTFEARKGSQIAVLIVPTVKPETIEQYAIRVAEVWKLGRKKIDDGILFLVAKNDREMRIEVGYGLEGVLPDLTANRIITEVVTPAFKQGDFFGGISAGVERIIRVVDGEPLPEPKATTSSGGGGGGDKSNLFFMAFVATFVFGGILRSIFGRFMGATVASGVAGFAAWAIAGSALFAVLLGFFAFFLTLVGGGRSGGFGGGGFGGGGFGGGGGGFSGGGGGFGGGGASGRW